MNLITKQSLSSLLIQMTSACFSRPPFWICHGSAQHMYCVSLQVCLHIIIRVKTEVYLLGFSCVTISFTCNTTHLSPTTQPRVSRFFFIPFISQGPWSKLNKWARFCVYCAYLCHFYLLVGNYYQQGNIRKQELFSSCRILGIPSSHVTVKDHQWVNAWKFDLYVVWGVTFPMFLLSYIYLCILIGVYRKWFYKHSLSVKVCWSVCK